MTDQMKLTAEQLHQLQGLRADEAVAVAQAEAAEARAESAIMRIQLVRAKITTLMLQSGVPHGAKVDAATGAVQLPRLPKLNEVKAAVQEMLEAVPKAAEETPEGSAVSDSAA